MILHQISMRTKSVWYCSNNTNIIMLPTLPLGKHSIFKSYTLMDYFSEDIEKFWADIQRLSGIC